MMILALFILKIKCMYVCIYQVSASYEGDEIPLDDESHLLVPIFKGEQTDAERIHRLLYSDEPLPSQYGSEVSIRHLSYYVILSYILCHLVINVLAHIHVYMHLCIMWVNFSPCLLMSVHMCFIVCVVQN